MPDPLYTALVVGAGCAANLLFSAMFIARVVAPERASTLGFAGTAMAAPFTLAALVAGLDAAEAWLVALPLVFVAFAAVEVVVDVISATDVRATRWLWPYLASFYLAQWAIIGAAFLASTAGGAAVLVTYFVCLTATAWSYRRVGHGHGSSTERNGSAGGAREAGDRHTHRKPQV
jgi:hypothetical protein